MLLRFVNFQLKLINFGGMNKRSVIILNSRTSQGSIATQTRWGGIPWNSYIEFPQEPDSDTELVSTERIPTERLHFSPV